MNTLIGIVLVLGLMILVHEWGHFIVARFFGVRVDVKDERCLRIKEWIEAYLEN